MIRLALDLPWRIHFINQQCSRVRARSSALFTSSYQSYLPSCPPLSSPVHPVATMDVIDIDTEHGTSDLLFNNAGLGMSNLSRSISQLSSTSYHPPATIQPPTLFPVQYPTTVTATNAHPFHFQQSDLEDSTFYVPPTSLQYQQTGNSLILPSLDRGLSILSQQSVTPAPVQAGDGDAYGDGVYVPAPFAPMRDMTGNLSLPPFDEQQQQQQQPHPYGNGSAPTGSVNGGMMSESAAYDAHQMYQQMSSSMQQQQLQQQMAMAVPATHPRHMHQMQLQQMQMHLKQSQQQHMQSQQQGQQQPQQAIPAHNSVFPNSQLDPFGQRLAPTPATTISTSDYDPSRKRQRADLPSLVTGEPTVPYYLEGAQHMNGSGFYGAGGAGSAHLPQSSPALAVSMSAPSSARAASTPQARPGVLIPAATVAIPTASSSTSPSAAQSSSPASQGGKAVSPLAMPAVPSRVHTAPANRSYSQAQQPAAETPAVDSSQSDDFDNASVQGRDSPPDGSSQAGDGEDKEQQKKVKHQMTDRQRRAKIKESMDQLKALVPLEANQKADQATIVAESVDMIKSMKDEIASLRAKLSAMELTGPKDGSGTAATPSSPMELSAAQRKALLQQSYASSSPLSAMLASLNGAGVSLLRLGLDGRVLEVNLVWEMVTGFSGADVVGRSPCSAPLYGSLSVMPKSFLRYFSTVSAAVSTPMLDGSVSPVSSNSSVNSPMLDGRGPVSPASSTSSSGSSDDGLPPLPPSGSNGGRMASAASPLFSNVTISSLPIVPHSELQSFYPFKCKTLPDTLSTNSTAPTPSQAAANASNAPLPHGQYLMNHLANLPPNHVLKLLSRVSTSYGDTLESIQTMCLVRNSTGAPDYVLCLTTPDGRRLVKPTKFLGGFGVSGGLNGGAGVGLGEGVRATG